MRRPQTVTSLILFWEYVVRKKLFTSANRTYLFRIKINKNLEKIYQQIRRNQFSIIISSTKPEKTEVMQIFFFNMEIFLLL